MIKLQRKLLLALAALTFAPAAFADAPTQGMVGVFIGPSFVNNGGGTNIDFGARGDYFFMPNLAGGIYISYGNVGSPVASVSTSLTSVLAEANWFVMNDRNLYVGAKLGLGFSSTSYPAIGGFTQPGSSQTSVGLGPAVGYLYPITPMISVGGEANYLIYTTSGGSTNVFNVLAQGVYFF